MKVIDTQLDGLVLMAPDVYGDKRGYFFEAFRQDWLTNLDINVDFVQDNESYSAKNILRGLHFQNPPHGQGKLVRVSAGAVLDVAVDIRKSSPTYGQHYKTVLSEENKHVLWIPEGFAHGFLTLKDNTRFLYKCTNYYHKESENSILWNDPQLNIDWGIENGAILSEKDLINPSFDALASPY